MKRILINASHNEEVRVALCKGNHLYDFDLENRTREQKKSNIYKGHVTRVEPSLEAVFVEYGSKRQGFLPVREISSEYLAGNPREDNIRKLIKEGDELIVQVEKEERGNKGAALSTYVSLAGRYLVLMPNNPKGGGISRQISGKLRDDMKRMLGNLDLPKGMSVIIRTAGISKTQEDLQHDLNHLLNIWNAIQEQNKKYPSPRLVHQEAGVVTRAVRDYLRDDVAEIWIDNEDAFIEAETFVKAVMPTQLDKLRKYTEYEPMFASFGVERQIETAYQREVRLPSGGSIVIDQTEALVSIDINSAKSTKGADVAETAYHTNLEAADEIARQLRLRDMGGLVVIDFIDMNDSKHQKDVEKRLVEATKYDRARVQFGEISRFGLLEMSRQRLRPSLEEATGYICPRCHGNGMIRDLRSLSLSIMRQIEQTALKERHGEVQAEVPTDIAAFLLNEKRESLVYLEQDSGTRITILPHAHLESPNFNLHFNHQGFAPSSYERVTDTQQQESSGRGYEVDWQTAEIERPEHQPTRQPRAIKPTSPSSTDASSSGSNNANSGASSAAANAASSAVSDAAGNTAAAIVQNQPQKQTAQQQASINTNKPAALAWLTNLFAPTPQAQTAATVSSAEAAQAIEAIVNTGAQSLGAFGMRGMTGMTGMTSASSDKVSATAPTTAAPATASNPESSAAAAPSTAAADTTANDADNSADDRYKPRQQARNARSRNSRNKYDKKNERNKSAQRRRASDAEEASDQSSNGQGSNGQNSEPAAPLPKRAPHSKRDSRGEIERSTARQQRPPTSDKHSAQQDDNSQQGNNGVKPYAPADTAADSNRQNQSNSNGNDKGASNNNEVQLKVNAAAPTQKAVEVVHICLDETTNVAKARHSAQLPAGDLTALELGLAVPKPPSEGEQQPYKDSAQSVSQAVQTATPSAKPLVEETVIKDAAVNDANPKQADAARDSAAATDPNADVNQAKFGQAKAVKDPAAKPALATEGAQAIFGFDTDTLFSNRYVAAKKFGQADNDPRRIKAAMQHLQATDPTATRHTDATADPKASRNIIEGTVGEFIHTHLANASLRLIKDGVISCFLAALSAHQQTSGSEPVTDLTIAALIPEPVFNFVNYGYEPLSSAYLQQFHTMTTAVAAYGIDAGKVSAAAIAPAAVGKRAANDPRGQHPDYTASPNSEPVAPNVAMAINEGNGADNETNSGDNDTSSNSADRHNPIVTVNERTQSASAAAAGSDKTPAQAMAELLQLNVGAFVYQVLAEEGAKMIAAGNTEAAFLKALRQPLAVLLQVANTENATTPTPLGPSTAISAQATEDKVTEAEAVTSLATTEGAVAQTNAEEDGSPQADGSVHIDNLNANAAEVLAPKLTQQTPADEHDRVSGSASNSDAEINIANSADAGVNESNASQTAEDTQSPSATASNKTSIESYKSMIETISQQLLPKTGLLKLGTVKVPNPPKPRSRKPAKADAPPDNRPDNKPDAKE